MFITDIVIFTNSLFIMLIVKAMIILLLTDQFVAINVLWP